jgi:hypothetical protein
MKIEVEVKHVPVQAGDRKMVLAEREDALPLVMAFIQEKLHRPADAHITGRNLQFR